MVRRAHAGREGGAVHCASSPGLGDSKRRGARQMTHRLESSQWRRRAMLVLFGLSVGLTSACEQGDETPIPPVSESPPADAGVDHTAPDASEASDSHASTADATMTSSSSADAGSPAAMFS